MLWGIKDGKRVLATPKDRAKCPLCEGKLISKCGSIKIWHWAHKSNKDCDPWYEPESEWHLKWKNEFPPEQQEVIIKKCKYFEDGCSFPKKHIADVKTNKTILELQNTFISTDDICDRENFYEKMIWLLNGETLCKGLDLRIKKDIITFRWKNPPKSWWCAEKPIYIDLSGIVDKFKIINNKYKKGKLKHTSPIYEQVEYEYYTPEAELIEVSYPKISDYVDTTKSEIKKLNKKIEIFENKIFLIKKIYHNIPCGGWGYILSKEEFLEKMNR